MQTSPPVIWRPDPELVGRTHLADFTRFAVDRGAPGERDDLSPAAYHRLQQWSVDDLEGFWAALVDWAPVRWRTPPASVLHGGARSMPGARWFPGGRLNYAEHAFAGATDRPDQVAVVSVSQSRDRSEVTWAELADQVARCRAGLVRLGVGSGDRVVGYLPNVTETIVAFLAAASLGAIWASCPPEFGTRAVIERFGQIEPTVLLAVDGYRYGDKAIDRRAEVERLQAALPSLRHTVRLDYLHTVDGDPGPAWAELLAEPGPLRFEPVPADHPLYVLYSSGTTGMPKPIVHGHGGITVEHLKVQRLHHDLGPDDRLFWFTTTGWMMWNYVVSALLHGTTAVLFDGDPAHPGLDRLWRLGADEAITVWGASAPFLMASRKAGLRPGRDHDLSRLRSVNSTGAPLPAEGFTWIAEEVGPNAQPVSISGGTDVCTAFLGMAPTVPVRAGRISVRCLGCGVDAVDDRGRSLPAGRTGELVLTEPLPSMPVGFWNDADGSRLRSSYFERFEGLWHHGDWITFSEDGGSEISGRSDATMNRGGVRLGTSDLYRCIEELPEVADCLVVHVEAGPDDEGGLGRLVLFVAPAPGTEVDDELVAVIRTRLRTELSPRHVPDEVIGLRAVPRTLSGKKLEVPVKRILKGEGATEVAALDALVDPEALLELEALVRARGDAPIADA